MLERNCFKYRMPAMNTPQPSWLPSRRDIILFVVGIAGYCGMVAAGVPHDGQMCLGGAYAAFWVIGQLRAAKNPK